MEVAICLILLLPFIAFEALTGPMKEKGRPNQKRSLHCYEVETRIYRGSHKSLNNLQPYEVIVKGHHVIVEQLNVFMIR